MSKGGGINKQGNVFYTHTNKLWMMTKVGGVCWKDYPNKLLHNSNNGGGHDNLKKRTMTAGHFNKSSDGILGSKFNSPFATHTLQSLLPSNWTEMEFSLMN